MEAANQRLLADGSNFDALFPTSVGRNSVIKQTADVADTVSFIKQIVPETLADTNKLAPLLRGKTEYETCWNIWNFVYQHIGYRRDTPGVEQVRRPARTWADRKSGVDCDCYTVFISSILSNLGIKHTLRITEYDNKGYWQHIYPIVPGTSPSGRPYITIDCVKDAFDDEQPFTKNKDYPMRLDRLDGLGSTGTGYIMQDYYIDGLGTVRKRAGRRVAREAVAQVNTSPTAPLVSIAPQQTPGQNNLVAATAQSANVQATPATITYNRGRLANGDFMSLGPAVPGGEFVNPYSGSKQGHTIVNFQLLRNGQWNGRDVLSRFIIKDGVLRGVKADGTYWIERGNNQGLAFIDGAIIKNPGVALAGLGQVGDISGGPELSAMVFAGVDGLGNIILQNGPVGRAGLWIDAKIAEQLFNNRATKMSMQGLDGFGYLEALFGDNIGMLDSIAQSYGDFEMDGLDDINGIAGDDFEIEGVDGLDGAHQIGNLGASEETFYFVNGLGGLGRARRRGGRGRGRSTSTSAAPVSKAVESPTGEKILGIYVPFNTLRNLLRLRNAQMTRLNANGHQFTSGSIPSQLSGLGQLGFWNNITQAFDKAWGGVRQAVSAVAPVVGNVASFASGGLIPGGAITAAANAITSIGPPMDNGSGQAPQSPQPVMQAAASIPVASATPATQAMAEAADYVAANNAEASAGYNANLNGMDGFQVSNQTLLIGAGVAAAAGLLWYATNKKGSGKQLNGAPRKRRKKRSSSSKNVKKISYKSLTA